ncbi:MAG: ABC transporter ATP-binding protein [Candidatus Sumerlaeaceae bacterium]|jgi:ABC-2 type transport system ATP-binding protein
MDDKRIPERNSPVIVCEKLSKWFGQVIALNNVSLEICSGIVGLLGPNGAGKTTLLELIIGRLRPSRGRVRVLGHDPWREPRLFYRLGYCPDTDGLYEKMSALEFVSLMGRLTGIEANESQKRARERLELVGLSPDLHQRIGEYSKGMRQRVKLAAALVHDPVLLVLDEPLNGLDPIARLKMIRLLRKLADDGLTILLSSHILAEVEALTSRIVLIHHGNILAEGQIEEIRSLIANQPYTYRIETTNPRALARALVTQPSIESVEFVSSNSAIIVRTTEALALCKAIQEIVCAKQCEVKSVVPVDDSLEAVFQYLVKQ